MELSEKFGRPILAFVDTAGAYPGIDAEERGQAEAIPARQPEGDGRAPRADRRDRHGGGGIGRRPGPGNRRPRPDDGTRRLFGLWQGASSLFGDDVTLNDAERTLVAVGHTRTVVSPEGSPPKGADRGPTVITARRVIYREAEATALFDGDVTVTRGPWHGSGQKVTALFGADRKIERVEMNGRRLAGRRRGGARGKGRQGGRLAGKRTGRFSTGSPAWSSPTPRGTACPARPDDHRGGAYGRSHRAGRREDRDDSQDAPGPSSDRKVSR